MTQPKQKSPRILLIDIETKPLLVWAWKIYEETMGLNQIEQDFSILSFSAQWYDPLNKIKSDIIYMDTSKKKDVEDDKELLGVLWNLMDEADIIIGHNSKKFDVKKINARFIMQGINGGKPPSPFKQIDTLAIARKHFALTSNKLEHIANILNIPLKKMKSKKFSGFEMWKQCIYKNKEAWKEMRLYNMRDVDVLRLVYEKLQAWDNSIDFNLYTDRATMQCNCGSHRFESKGFTYKISGTFRRYVCKDCGAPMTSKINLRDEEKKASLKKDYADDVKILRDKEAKRKKK